MSPSHGSPARKSYEDFVREALKVIEEAPVAAARAAFDRQDGTVFLDVREPSEFAKGTIPGALTIARGRLESDAPDWIFEPLGPVVVYCNTGKRSALAVKTLLEMGFAGARSLQGGLAAWQAAGHPVGPPRPM